MSLVIRKVDRRDGAVSVEGIGAFSMARDGTLTAPKGAALTDDDLRRVFATLPPGYEIGEVPAPKVPDPEPAPPPVPAEDKPPEDHIPTGGDA